MTKNNDFSCVILAGGKGERLYPITESRPKPLCPVAGVTPLERAIKKASSCGVKDIKVTACYKHNMISEFLSKSFSNVKFVREFNPLGTAGAVRACADEENDVLVISGDIIFDFDLSLLIKKHFETGSLCTIALTRFPYPTEYGVVSVKDDVITRFTEKPSWSKVTGDLINTGIYMISSVALRIIPKNVEFDFSSHLFPAILAREGKLSYYIFDDYWCDIGNPKSFYDCTMSITDGENSIHHSSSISNSASVISSIVMENVSIGDKAVVDSSIICENTVISSNALVPAGCVIGAGCHIGENAVLKSGITLAPNTVIKKGEHIMKDVKFGIIKGRLFDGDDAINGVYGISFTPADAFSLGHALCESTSSGTGRIGVMHNGEPAAKLLASEIGTGIRYGGGEFFVLGQGFSTLCGFSVKQYGLDFACFVNSSGNEIFIDVYGKDSFPVNGDTARVIEKHYLHEGIGCTKPKEIRVADETESPIYLYAEQLLASCSDLHGICVSVDTDSTPGNALATSLERSGASVHKSTDGGIYPHIAVKESGKDFSFVFKDGKAVGKWHFVAYFLSKIAAEKGRVFVPESTPYSVTEYVEKHGGECVRDNSRVAFNSLHDSGFLICSVLSSIRKDNISFEEFESLLPEFHILTVIGDYDESKKASKIRELCEECGSEGRPEFRFSYGRVFFIPDTVRGFRIISEAVSSEHAKELCDFALSKLNDETPDLNPQ